MSGEPDLLSHGKIDRGFERRFTMSKIRVGVMGAGRGTTMMEQLRHSNDAELVAICDFYRPALEAAGKAFDENGLNIKIFDNFEEFLSNDMDAVVLAN